MTHAIPRTMAPPLVTRSSARTLLRRAGWWLGLVALCGWLGWLELREIGPYPTGLDSGGWLAFGRSWFGGGHKGDDATFPYFVPTALHLGAEVFGPFTAVKLFSALALLAGPVATGIVLKKAGGNGFVALAAVALAAISTPILETATFGGHPQNLALGIMVASVAFTVYLMRTQQPRFAVALALSLGALSLVHHAYFVVTVLSVGAAVLLAFVARRERWPSRAVLFGCAGAVAFGAAAFAVTYSQLLALGYSPPVGVTDITVEGTLEYAIRDNRPLWGGVLVSALAYALVTVRRSDHVIRHIALALAGPSLVLLFITTEVRLYPPVLLAAVMLCGAATSDFLTAYQGRRLQAMAGALVVAVVLGFGLRSHLIWQDLVRTYYQVLDEDLVATIDFTKDGGYQGRVAVRDVRGGWPVGWWFQGLTDESIVVGSDTRWLAFDREVSDAHLADELFHAEHTSGEVVAIARSQGVQVLVGHKIEWAGWPQLLAPAGPYRLVFENAEWVVLVDEQFAPAAPSGAR